jgi:hypothetical protein
MHMSRTTASIPLKSSSLTPYCTSCEIQFPKNGTTSEVRSQTTFASSLTKTFGFWSEGGIDRIKPEIFASIAIKQDLLPRDDILMAMYHLSDVALRALKSSGKTIFLGNGGSFADAEHL